MKKLLILGGTRFLGRNLIEKLLELNEQQAQYEITLFNRGQSNPNIFSDVPNLKTVQGDRETDDIKLIAKEDWDCVIDTSCFYPIPLNDLLERLRGKVGRYVLVSTSSHYNFEEDMPVPTKEDWPLVDCTEAQKIDREMMTYNNRKAECERIISSMDWLDKIILRPALVVGKYDYSDRLYHWFHRVQTQKQLLYPNDGKVRISYSDISDFARIMIQAIDVPHNFDVYNASSYNASIGDVVKGAMKALDKSPELVNASIGFLAEHKIKQWLELPLWLDTEFHIIDNSRLKKDFNFTPNTLDDTIVSLVEYYNTLNWYLPGSNPFLKERKVFGGISLEKEQKLIDLIKQS